MSRYQVDSEQVAGASTAVRSSMGVIGGEVDAMMRHLVALEGSWQGRASAAFQGVAAEWRATQQQVHAALESIGEALAASGRTYETAESDAVRMFAR